MCICAWKGCGGERGGGGGSPCVFIYLFIYLFMCLYFSFFVVYFSSIND